MSQLIDVNSSLYTARTLIREQAQVCCYDSLKAQGKGNYLASWAYTVPARMMFLADVVASLFFATLALLPMTFHTLKGLYEWKFTSFDQSAVYFATCINQSLVSLFGAVISPTIAARQEDGDLVALRVIMVIMRALAPNGVSYNRQTGITVHYF